MSNAAKKTVPPDMKPVGGDHFVPKVVALGWSIRDEPGEFAWIPKQDLRIEPAYQRDKISGNRVRAIARDWSWVALGALIVARRADGSFWVIDGQHRKLAADNRTDVERLPCVVFAVEGIRQEAAGFVGANTVRGPVSAYHTFRANLVAGDQTAVAVNEMVRSSGYRIVLNGDGHHQVCCVATLCQHHSCDPDRAAAIWGVAVRICDPNVIPQKLLRALFFLEGHLASERCGRRSLTNSDIAQRLCDVGVDHILFSMNNAAIALDKGGERSWAEGVLRVINKHRRSGRIPSLVASNSAE